MDNHQQDEIPRRKKDNKKNPVKNQYKWAATVFIISFFITAILSLLSEESMQNMNVIVALIILFIFIAIGIIFDVIGLAVATAAEGPFHSMAARKNKVGSTAVKLLKNADRVSSVCNDVVGDIAGVVSGATGAAIAMKLFADSMWLSLLLTSLVAAFTVGGKAMCKRIAITKSEKIVITVAKILSVFKREKKKK